MRELGYKPIMLWVTPLEHALLKAVAKRLSTTVVRFVVDAAVERANGLPLS